MAHGSKRSPVRGARPRRLVLAAALAVGCLVPLGCERSAEAPDPAVSIAPAELVEPVAEPARLPNVVLVSIDNLRPDRLGVYGDDRPTAPALDRLAAESVVFENAYSTSSWTLPSHVSMFSGLHPKTHRAVLGMTKPLATIPMLSEILHDVGYRTIAITAGGWVSEGFGFARGFDAFDVVFPPRAAVKKAIADLKEVPPDQPFFLFFHTFGVHCPFMVPESYRAMFDTRPEEDHFDLREKCGDTHLQQMDLTEGQIEFVSDRYDAGIRTTNDHLRWLFTFLDNQADGVETILIVTSDHGEEFNEHGRMGHGRALYAETLRVPLLLRAPGIEPRRVEQPTSLVDIAPTVLALLGLPVDGMEGQSLVPRLRGGDAADDARPLFAETSLRGEKARSVLFEGRQLIANLREGTTEVFDLAADPEQRSPLGGEAEDLSRLLADHFGAEPSAPEATVAVSEERLEQLRALGYVD